MWATSARATSLTTGRTRPRRASWRATRLASRSGRAWSATSSGPRAATGSGGRRRRMSYATGEARPRLAVLGADGFVGSHVVSAALAAGADATAICGRPPWRLERLGAAPSRLVQVPDGCWWDRAGHASIAAAMEDAD